MMKVSIKIPGVNFGNYVFDNSKWDKISDGIAKKNMEQSGTLFERGNCKLNPLIESVVHRSNLYYSKIYQKRIHDFLWNRKKIRPSRHLVQLSISTSGLCILDVETQLNSLKIK